MYGGLPTGEADRWVKTTPTNPAILTWTAAWEQVGGTAVVEPDVLTPDISPDGNWWMYYRGGWTTLKVGLATCPVNSNPAGASNWTKNPGNPVFTGLSGNGAAQFHILPGGKIGGSYYAIYNNVNGATATVFRYATSADGLTWADGGQALAPTLANWWYKAGAPAGGNTSVYYDGSTYHLMFEAQPTGSSPVWQVGRATSANPQGPYTEVGGNPISSLAVPGLTTSTASGPFTIKVGSTFHTWLHCAGSTGLPTRIYRFTQADITSNTWAFYGPVQVVSMTESAAVTAQDQVADLRVYSYGGTVYGFYDIDDNVNKQGKCCLATFAGTLAQLVGDGPSAPTSGPVGGQLVAGVG